MPLAVGETSHNCLKKHSENQSAAVLDDCSFIMEMLFPLHGSKKEKSGKRQVKGKTKKVIAF